MPPVVVAPPASSSSVAPASLMLASLGASSRIRNHQPAKAPAASTRTTTPAMIPNVRREPAMSPPGVRMSVCVVLYDATLEADRTQVGFPTGRAVDGLAPPVAVEGAGRLD